MPTMNLGKRLGKALEIVGMKATDLSRASGVPAPTIRALINRDSTRSEYLEQILTALPPGRINADWVRTGRGKPETGEASVLAGKEGGAHAAAIEPTGQRSGESGLATVGNNSEHLSTPSGDEWVRLPKLGVIAPMPGTNSEARIVKLHDESELFRPFWMREGKFNATNLVWHDAIDDSMDRVICKGDVYVVDLSQNHPIDGAVYAIWYGGGVRPRRVHLLPTGGLRLKAENPTHETVDVTEQQASTLRIIGRVVHREGRGGL